MRRPMGIRIEQRSLVARLPLPAPFHLVFEGSWLLGGDDPRTRGLGGWSLPIQHRPTARAGGDGEGATVDLLARRERVHLDGDGRVERIEDLLTGRPRWILTHDAQRLVEVTDGRGRSWQLDSDARGEVTGVITPDGGAAGLAVDGEGWLEQLSLPDGRTWRFQHTGEGLLTQLEDADGRRHVATHDDDGRLARLEQPGLTSRLVVAEVDGAVRTTLLRSDGSESSVAVERLDSGRVRRTRRCCGMAGTTVTESGGGGPVVTVHPDGTTVTRTTTRRPDPVWGTGATEVVERTIVTPAGRKREIRRWVERSDEAAREVLEVDGRRHEHRWDPTTRTVTATTPEGRTTTVTHDVHGRPVEVVRPDGVRTVHEYGPDGQLVATRTGPHRVHVTTGTAGGTVMSDGTRTTSVRVGATDAEQHLADGRVLAATTDETGAVDLTLDGEVLARFERDAGDGSPLQLRCVLPEVGGQASTVTIGLDPRGRLDEITDDVGSIRFQRSTGGPVDRVVTADGITEVEHDEAGRRVAVRGHDGLAVEVTRDGALPLTETTSGPAAGTVEHLWDGMRRAGYRVGGFEVAWQRDADGRIVRAGPVELVRDDTGRVTAQRCGIVTARLLHDEHGRSTGRVVEVAGREVGRFEDVLDEAGRRVGRQEVIDGATTEFGYRYDDAGRLVEVVRDGEVRWTAQHDQRGNRVRTEADGTTWAAVHDARDRIVHHAGADVRYDDADRLVARRDDRGTTTYRYDPFGNLAGASTVDGHEVVHTLDPAGRRVATTVDGVRTRRLLWLGDTVVGAAAGGAGPTTMFVHAGGRVPLAAVCDGRTHVLVADHLGTIRLAVDAQTGEITQRVDLDPDGRVLRDTAPGLHPFGFAGGLQDPTTGLVRMGAREYDPRLARFTRRDPLLFAGGSTNLHEYANGDPVNRVDPSGLMSGGAGGGGGGGSVYMCSTDFMGGAEHGMIGIKDADGNGRLYGMEQGTEGGLQTQWADQSDTHGNDPSRKCEEVPDVDPECVMDQIKNPDGTYKETGSYGVDPFGMSETSPGIGMNVCWNPVMDAIRACGGDPYESIPTESTWDEVMSETYKFMDASRQMSGWPGRAADEVASWFD